MIEQIRRTNRGVSPDFLESFDESALSDYLRRLTTVLGRRGRDSVWVRRGDSPAVVARA
ncbi:MAG: hypothetical protein AAF710_11180 [Planctomycetota bacterium]